MIEQPVYRDPGRLLKMDYVMRIHKGSRALNGSVHNPDKIIKMTILADDQKAGTAKK